MFPASSIDGRSPLGFRRRRSAVILIGALAGAMSVTAAPGQASELFAAPARVELVRSIETDDIGVRRPEGISYARRDGALVVPRSAGRRTELVHVGLGEERIRSWRVARLARAATLAALPDGRRVVAADRRGVLTLTRGGRALRRRLALRAPAGAAVDAGGRAVYVLDAGARAIVRAPLGAGAPTRIRLPRRLGQLRGLARSPVDGLFYVLSADRGRLLAFDGRGRLKRDESVASLGLVDPRALAFAPTGDPTDAARRHSLYIADAGPPRGAGGIVEADVQAGSVFATAAVAEVATATFVKMIDTSQYTPSSPDPSGIIYNPATDRFMISDSEVEEMPLYQGSNLFTATRTGSGTGTGTTVAYSKEPAGLGYRASDNALFVSDDDGDRVTIVKTGPDGRHGTADDVWTRFSTAVFGSTDPEGVEYDEASGRLVVCDGSGLEVYIIDPRNGTFGDADDVMTHFDIGQFTARDCEGLGIDPQRGTILALDPSRRKIYETTFDGVLLRTIDLNPIPTKNRAFAGITMAPTSNPSDSPSQLSYWIVDRHVDNGTDPNENDGLLYEVTVPTADPPPTVSITTPAAGSTVGGTVALAANASDAGGVAQVRFTVDGTAVGTDTDGSNGWGVAWPSTGVPDGSHTIAAVATDTIGQTATASITVNVHNADDLPTVTLTAPGDGTTLTGVITMTASAQDDRGIARVEFLVDGTTVASDTSAQDGWSASWDTTAFADGTHTVAAKAVDTGGQSASDQHTVTVDNVDSSPTVAITAPADGATVTAPIDVRATAADDRGVTEVRFAVNGDDIGVDTDGSDGWSVRWAADNFANGAYTLTATAVDTANQIGMASRSVTVAVPPNLPPTVALSSPAEGAVVAGTVTLQASASDDRGVSSVRFAVDGAVVGTDTDGADGWSATWTTATSGDGQRRVSATATDTNGLTATAERDVTVDNNAPTVAVTSPEAGSRLTGTVAVVASATDAVGVTSVTVSVDGVTIGTDSSAAGGWSVSWDTRTAQNGSRTITAVARDGAGNATTSSGVTVTVDNPPATTVLTVPVVSGVDDATQLNTTGAVSRTNGDLELGTDQGTPATVGLRFTGLSIPAGAQISRAHVQFQADETGKDVASLTVTAEAADNAGPIASTAFGLSSRPRTTASVAWAPPRWLVVGAAGIGERTPDLAPVVQEVVNRPGWAPGNALMVLVTGSGRRTAESFEGGAPPVLVLEYVNR